MGTGASRSPRNVQKEIFVRFDDTVKKVVFASNCSTRDIKDLLASTAGVTRWACMSLQTSTGEHVVVSPAMPVNDRSNPYILNVSTEDSVDREVIGEALDRVSELFSNAFKVNDMKQEMQKRLGDLEKQVHADGLKLVEVEKCKRELRQVREQLLQGTVSPSRCYNCSQVRDDLQQLTTDLSYSKYTLSEDTMELLKKPTFNIWNWEPNEMLSLLEHMYHELGLVQEFNMNPLVLRQWLRKVQSKYRNNPFHNFRHCFCVTQMMYGMIHLCELQRHMDRRDLGILLTACVCHDLDHPGFNNSYQIKARTELALRYNDISPLENHHCAVAFNILAIPECNIFANVPESSYAEIRSGIITLIMATDMAHHDTLLKRFRKQLDAFSFDTPEDKKLLQIILVKCCDISNEVRPSVISEPWADCLLEEYFQQGDREKREGLPVDALMDRDKISKPQAQCGFIRLFLIPLFESVARLFPLLEDAMIRQLRDSLRRYEQMQEDKEEQKKEKLASLPCPDSETSMTAEKGTEL